MCRLSTPDSWIERDIDDPDDPYNQPFEPTNNEDNDFEREKHELEEK
jgi:hypothetical protein